MKPVLTTILLFLAAMFANAQDIIHTLDTPPIQAKVLEIGERTVRYKAYDNLDGPDYVISVNRLVKIVLANGTVKSFGPNPFYDSPYDINPRYGYGYEYGYGPIRYHSGHFYDQRNKDMADIIGVSRYGSRYLKAKDQLEWGSLLTVTGAAMLGGAIFFAANSSGMGTNGSGYAVAGVAGAVGMAVGIPLWIKGNKKMHEIADDYNQSLTIGSTPSGVGLSFNF